MKQETPASITGRVLHETEKQEDASTYTGRVLTDSKGMTECSKGRVKEKVLKPKILAKRTTNGKQEGSKSRTVKVGTGP